MTTHNIHRRSFLRIGAAAAGVLMLPVYAEPEGNEPIEESAQKNWVDDRGSFYLVRVPDEKTFSREMFDKPTIFLLGVNARVSQCAVFGHTNILMKSGSQFVESEVDVRRCLIQDPRPPMVIQSDPHTNVFLERLYIKNSDQCKSQPGIFLNNLNGKPWLTLSTGRGLLGAESPGLNFIQGGTPPFQVRA